LFLKAKNIPEKSSKRYISSLNKYFKYLVETEQIKDNPLILSLNVNNSLRERSIIDEFRNNLVNNKLSYNTIKNYINDINSFILWLNKISKGSNILNDKAELLIHINSENISEYKNRLALHSTFSPTSINRKLSSIRKFSHWLNREEIITSDKKINLIGKKTSNKINNNTQKMEIDISNYKKILENNINININQSPVLIEKEPPLYRISDLLIVLPIIYFLNKIKYISWLLNGKHIFKAEKNFTKNKSHTSLKYVYERPDKSKIKNIPKSFYAPLKISLDKLPWHKVLVHKIKYYRPKWYKKYHSYPFSNYIHIGILIITTAIYANLLYDSVYPDSNKQKAVLANSSDSKTKILSFSGKLTDSNNNPITSESQIRFSLYNQKFSSGSAMLWQEVQTIKPDINGKFNATIGKINSISGSIFIDNPNLYLGITIGPGKELAPRQALATIGLSQNSETLRGLLPITQNGSGTKNVVLALDSSGNLTIGGKSTPIFQATGGKFTLSGQILSLNTEIGTNTNVEIEPDGKGIIDLKKPIQNTSNYNNINSAIGAVEIDDIFAILATSSGQSAFTLNQNSTGPLISASSSGIAKFTLENDGSAFFAGKINTLGNSFNSKANSYNLLNQDVINLNLAGSATSISIGALQGSTSINNTLIAKGGLTISPNRTLIVSGSIASDLNPFLTSTYNLGSPLFRWKNAYIDNIITNPNASVSGFWQKEKGSISLVTSSDDLIIGGSATKSAKFQIIASGIYAGTASSSGHLTFTNNSQINLLNNSNLGFYNSIAGNSGMEIAPALFINSNGKIGIGTNNPTSKLDINGDVKTKILKIASSGYLQFENESSNPLGLIKGVDSGILGSKLSFSTRNSTNLINERLILDETGSLILGNHNANATLDVKGNSGTSPVALFIGSTSKSALIIENNGEGDIITASSSGTTRFVITKAGNIGINDSNPGNTLKVTGSICASTSSGNCAGNTPGTIYASNTTLQNADIAENYISSEKLAAGELIMPEGESNNLAVIKTKSAKERKIIGVISDKPGLTLNSEAKLDHKHPYLYPVALSGRVPVKVTSENGFIKTGDYITSSSIHGVGMKSTDKAMVIGMALEDYNNPDKTNIGTITVFINLTYYDPFSSGREDNLYSLISQNIISGFRKASGGINNYFESSSGNLTSVNNLLTQFITNLIEPELIKSPSTNINSSTLEIISPLASPSALLNSHEPPSAHLNTDENKIIASSSGKINLPKDLESPELNVQTSSVSAEKIASLSGLINSIPASDSAESPASLSAEINSSNYITSSNSENIINEITNKTNFSSDLNNFSSLSARVSFLNISPLETPDINQTAVNYGHSLFSDISVVDNLTIGGSLILKNNSINTFGSTLELQPLKQGNLSIMGNLIIIDTQGNLKVSGNAAFSKNLSVKGRLSAGIIGPHANSDLIINLKNKSDSDLTQKSSQFIIQNSSSSGVFKVNELGDLVASGSGAFSQLASKGFNIIRGAEADTSLTETLASSSAGIAFITENETERTIITPFANEESLIYLSVASDSQGLIPYIARQSKNSFTVAIPYPISNKIKINWWIIN
jgi:hypothetical protein